MTLQLLPLTDDHFEPAFRLDLSAAASLGEETYAPFKEERLHKVLQLGQSIGAFDGERLTAVLFIETPAILADEVFAALALPPEERTLIGNLCGIVVEPQLRHRGIGKSMTEKALDRLKAAGMHYAYATVAPHNFPSLANVFSLDFVGRAVRPMYGCGPRLLLVRDLKSRTLPGQASELCAARDMPRQEALFKAGYEAVGAAAHDGEVMLKFACRQGKEQKPA